MSPPDWHTRLAPLVADSSLHAQQERRRYRGSGTWRRKRMEVMAITEGRCCRCTADATEVHHLTYERVGCERLEDLEPLCSDCHTAEHRDGRSWATRVEAHHVNKLVARALQAVGSQDGDER